MSSQKPQKGGEGEGGGTDSSLFLSPAARPLASLALCPLVPPVSRPSERVCK